MEACTAVEREIDKVLSKFSSFSDQATSTLNKMTTEIEMLKRQIDEGKKFTFYLIYNKKQIF